MLRAAGVRIRMQIQFILIEVEAVEINCPGTPALEEEFTAGELVGVLEDADGGVDGDFVGGNGAGFHVPEPEEGFTDEAGLAVDVDEGGVGSVGGEEGVVGHGEPEEAELVPAAGAAEGAEDNVVVDGVGEVGGEGFEVVKEAEGAAPGGLGFEY